MFKLHKWLFGYLDLLTLYGGGKGSSSPPPAPDYRGAAQEQGAASKEITAQQTWANRPELTTPWGTQTWQSQATTDPATGTPVTQWSSDISLDPAQQAALDDQMAIQAGRSGAAKTLLDQATGAFQTPFDWEGLPDKPGNLSDAQGGAFAKMSALLQPARAEKEMALETRLANMGLDEGTEAYARAKRQLGDENTREDLSLLTAALGEGRQDLSSQQASRTAAIAEEAQRRGMTLNELNALLTGQQVSLPQMPGFTPAQGAQAPNYLGAAQSGGQYGLGATQLNQSGGMDWGTAAGGIATIAAIAM